MELIKRFWNFKYFLLIILIFKNAFISLYHTSLKILKVIYTYNIYTPNLYIVLNKLRD